jgi:hypothetical protein
MGWGGLTLREVEAPSRLQGQHTGDPVGAAARAGTSAPGPGAGAAPPGTTGPLTGPRALSMERYEDP